MGVTSRGVMLPDQLVPGGGSKSGPREWSRPEESLQRHESEDVQLHQCGKRHFYIGNITVVNPDSPVDILNTEMNRRPINVFIFLSFKYL